MPSVVVFEGRKRLYGVFFTVLLTRDFLEKRIEIEINLWGKKAKQNFRKFYCQQVNKAMNTTDKQRSPRS